MLIVLGKKVWWWCFDGDSGSFSEYDYGRDYTICISNETIKRKEKKPTYSPFVSYFSAVHLLSAACKVTSVIRELYHVMYISSGAKVYFKK